MKRIQLKKLTEQKLNSLPENLPENLSDYISSLKLLHGVPFSYLIADENSLPPESIRFFYIDEKWTEALAEGALSIGRVSDDEAADDKLQLKCSADFINSRLRTIRLERMHENHKKNIGEFNVLTRYDIQSGFIMRSVLTRRMNGLEVIGKNGNTNLEILRMETLSDDVLICFFDGDITSLVISEPKVGLRFGCPDNSGLIKIRKIDDDDNFGEYINETVNLKNFTQENGRLNVSKLARQFEKILNTEVGSAQFAFELIAAAHRMEFMKK